MNKCVGFVLLLWSITIQHSTAQTHVQTTSLFQYATATTISCSFVAASTSGNLIVVHLDWSGQTRNTISVTDDKGNSYAKINGPTNWDGTNYGAELWYAYNIQGGGTPITITAQLSGAPTDFYQIYMSEYAGIITTDPLDRSSVATGGTSAVSSGSATTRYTHELIYGASIGATDPLLTGDGYTSRSTENQNNIEDKNVSSAGTYDAAFISVAGNWVAQMATFISSGSSLVLPVQLFSFTGKCNDNHIDLAWSTVSEMNNDYFTVERSEDGTNWNAIGTVPSAGNSLTIQNYAFTAGDTSKPFSRFRLKQTYLNGSSQYFPAIQVDNCSASAVQLNIYTNPSNGTAYAGRLYLHNNEPYTVAIYDNLGKLVTRIVSNQPEFRVNFPQILPGGIYYALFSSANFNMSKCFLVTQY